MKSWLVRLFTPQAIHFGKWEAFLMRLGFCYLLWIARIKVSPLTAQESPNGLAHFIDFTFLSDPLIAGPLGWLWILLMPLYLFSVGDRFTLPIFTVLAICNGTLGNSQGAINHGSQIFAMVLVAQTVSVWWAYLARRNNRFVEVADYLQSRRDWMISASMQTVAATYLVTAITKLIESGGMWVHNIPFIAVQFVKNHDMVFYNHLKEPSAETSQFMIDILINQPNLARLIFGTGITLEFFAFLGLLNRKWALLMGIALIAMHETISEIMHLGFLSNKILLLIFFVNIPYWVMAGVHRLRR